MFPKPLRRDILVLLGLKAAALMLIYLAFVAPAATPDESITAMTMHLLSGEHP
jgi:hypothetical protein